jgi:hypothetical protein
VSEAEFQKKITQLCDFLRLTWHHETDSRRSKKGFPDLVIAGPNGVIFAELKTDTGRVTPEQNRWIEALRLGGAIAQVWRPRNWEAIEAILFDIAGRRLPSGR